MNLQTIKTDDYWLLIDKSHKENCSKWTYSQEGIYISTCKGVEDDYEILAHLPIGDAPLLEGVPVLPEHPHQTFKKAADIARKDEDLSSSLKEELVDFFDSELPKQEDRFLQILLDKLQYHKFINPDNIQINDALINVLEEIIGDYKAASQGKMYSEEQLKDAFEAGYEKGQKDAGDITVHVPDWEEFFQSLSPVQEQEWVFEPEWETEYYDTGINSWVGAEDDDTTNTRQVLKTIPNPESPNNPILVGKWIKK